MTTNEVAHTVDGGGSKESSSADSENITVFVGPERKEFSINKKIICSASKFFEKCVGNQNFQEGITGIVNLPEEDPGWFYHLIDLLTDPQPYKATWSAESDVEVYKLADKFEMIQFKNDLIDNIRKDNRCKCDGEQFCVSDVRRFFEQVHESNIEGENLLVWSYYKDLCAYALAHGTRCIVNDDEEPDGKELEHVANFFTDGSDMAADVFRRLLLLLNVPRSHLDDPSREVGCFYHDHSDGSKCRFLIELEERRREDSYRALRRIRQAMTLENVA